MGTQGTQIHTHTHTLTFTKRDIETLQLENGNKFWTASWAKDGRDGGTHRACVGDGRNLA